MFKVLRLMLLKLRNHSLIEKRRMSNSESAGSTPVGFFFFLL